MVGGAHALEINRIAGLSEAGLQNLGEVNADVLKDWIPASVKCLGVVALQQRLRSQPLLDDRGPAQVSKEGGLADLRECA